MKLLNKTNSPLTTEEIHSWIKQKSKTYGNRNKFLASAEYKKIYPVIKKLFANHNKSKKKEVLINKEENGKFSLNYAQAVHGNSAYVASGRGIFGGKALYNNENEAIENARKLGLTISV